MFFIVVLAVYAQEVIENSRKPQNENAGRVLAIKEEFRIDGQGEGYYFNGAHKLRIDESGNIYICDSWSSQQRSHLLRFSPEGKFLLDLYKQGEGPGEIQSAFDFALSETEVFLHDWMKRKTIVESPDGRFIKEFKTQSGSMSDFVGIFEDWLVFFRREHPLERKTSKLYDVENVIVFVSKDGDVEEDFHIFINQTFYVSQAQVGGGMGWDPFMVAMGDEKLFVCHAQEYLIEVLDLNTGEITARFKRDYPRIGHERQKREKDFVSKYNAPNKKYEIDIKNLFYDRGRIWVQTSTEDDEKGFLFDVFDTEGHFLDNFYVNVKGRILMVDGDFLYSAENDEDELPLVVKYRIVDSFLERQPVPSINGSR